MAKGQLRAKSNFLLNKLPRRIKSIPLVEALTGTTVSGFCEAIFDADVAEDENLFDETNDEQMRHLRSDLENAQLSPPSRSKAGKRSPSPHRTFAEEPMSRPRLRVQSAVTATGSAKSMNDGGQSPLTRFFTSRAPTETQITEATLKRIESLVDDMRNLPIQRLKDEMNELQVCIYHK